MHSSIRSILLICLLSCTGCHAADSSQEIIQNIAQDIDNQQFEAAHQKLEDDYFYTLSEDKPLLDYNHAVIDILSGKCEKAKAQLEKQLKALEDQNFSSNFTMSTQSDDSVQKTRLHHALAIALVCPTVPSYIPNDADMETALSHLYQASSLGLNVRDDIAQILKTWIKPCHTFIPESLKEATNPEKAIAVGPSRDSEIVLCHDGLWFKFEARQNEIIKAKFTLKPLDRKVWMDESSQLPFTQFHADMHMAPNQGERFTSPSFQFEQPLPIYPPAPEDYETQILQTPEIQVEKTGNYFLHLYTQKNGEARVIVSFEKLIDCGAIDDTVTYNSALEQTPVSLETTPFVEFLTLCPERPDVFSFTIAPEQFALIYISSPSPHLSNLDFLQIHIQNDKGEEIPQYAQELTQDHPSRIDKSQPYYILFSPHQTEAQNKEAPTYPAFILIHNPTQEVEHATLNLRIHSPHEPMAYAISYTESHPCDEAQETLSRPLNLKDIEQTKSFAPLPVWTCPGTRMVHHPVFPPNTHVLRVKTDAHFLATTPVRKDDFQLSSYLHSEAEHRDFIIENGGHAEIHWDPMTYVMARQLQKPMSQDTRIQTTISSENSGFVWLNVTLNDDNSEDTNDSKKQNKPTQNAQKKDQRDNANKQNTPNKSPEKPSETPAVPQGPGTDTQGDESTPDPNTKSQKASKLDLKQHEKDNIDALLDAIENGNLYVPMSGQKKSDKALKQW